MNEGSGSELQKKRMEEDRLTGTNSCTEDRRSGTVSQTKGSVADQNRPTLTTVKPNGKAGSIFNLTGVIRVVKDIVSAYHTGGIKRCGC
jgi:hypothetical protein